MTARHLAFLAPPPPEPLLRFERKAGGREVALLGVVEVGEFRTDGEHPAHRLYYWRCFLPMCQQLGRAASPEIARNQLRARIEQWVEAAGLRGAST